MILMIAGTILFFGIHALPFHTGWRNTLINKTGEKPYKGIFSLVALTGLLLIGLGYSTANYHEIWPPVEHARSIALIIMPLTFILLASANMKSHIRRLLKHPMSIGIMLWSGAHLLANGDQASILLFGSFFIYALISMISAEMRLKYLGDGSASLKFDAIAVISGILLYALVLSAHGLLFGVSIH